MSSARWRPRATSLLREWGRLIANEPSGPGFDFTDPRQARFRERVDAFRTDPRAETFEDIWTPESAVAHANPGGQLLRQSFDGTMAELASFLDTLRTADEYRSTWEDRLPWHWALWEAYTRLNDAEPLVLTREAAAALSWLGTAPSGTFHERRRLLRAFAEEYASVVGHATAGTAHQVPTKTEIDELTHVVQSLDGTDISPHLKGPYGEFYRLLYGGGGDPPTEDRCDRVTLSDVGPLVRAFAWGKANDAYDRDEAADYWGGTYWETWKEAYASHVATEIRDEYTLTDLQPDEIGTLFEALTNAEASGLSKPVATYVMGSQWGQYTWNDVVDHFRANAEEASQVLSLFFDESRPVVNRLEAFREHTIHLTETADRSPGSIERMATSLLMFTHPETHLGLPPSRTGQFLEERSTLERYESGFGPQQSRRAVGPLRGLRDELQSRLATHGSGGTVTMLDVHTLIWIYGGEGDPKPAHLPDDGA